MIYCVNGDLTHEWTKVSRRASFAASGVIESLNVIVGASGAGLGVGRTLGAEVTFAADSWHGHAFGGAESAGRAQTAAVSIVTKDVVSEVSSRACNHLE